MFPSLLLTAACDGGSIDNAPVAKTDRVFAGQSYEQKTLQEALEVTDCYDGTIILEGDTLIDGKTDFNSAGCSVFRNLTIKTPYDQRKAHLKSFDISEGDITMIDMTGGHEVTFRNVHFQGFIPENVYSNITAINSNRSQLNIEDSTFSLFTNAVRAGAVTFEGQPDPHSLMDPKVITIKERGKATKYIIRE